MTRSNPDCTERWHRFAHAYCAFWFRMLFPWFVLATEHKAVPFELFNEEDEDGREDAFVVSEVTTEQ